MDYKEKYEQALENLKRIKNANRNNKELVDFIECQYPELKESKNVKIKKTISDILLIDSDEIREILDANNVLIQDIFAWLEKQGEQSLEEKVNEAMREVEKKQKHSRLNIKTKPPKKSLLK